MNRLDEPRDLNRDALLDTLYEIQASLTILSEHLTRERNPDLSDRTLLDLANLHCALQQHYPSLQRH